MARYERDFMGRVRGMFGRLAGGDDRPGRRPMGASGPGAEGYYLSPEMAYDTEYALRQRERTGYDRGYGIAQFGRSGSGRGYGGEYRTGRGGYDRGEFFVNRRPGSSGYRTGRYERDLGARGGMAAGRRGYDHGSGGYDRGFGYHR
ncbi:MAG TPA: hypothetical protein VHG93_26955 [Longimicrobium sp.]|nr:hypothetical protein [Longimicrobium sp.]